MSVYDEKPWLARYAAGQPAEIDVEYDNVAPPRAAHPYAGRRLTTPSSVALVPPIPD
jgi:hypothetical protein